MKRKLFAITGVTVILGAILALAACSNGGASAQGTSAHGTNAQGGTYSPISITPTINGDNVSIPASTVNSSKNVEFNVKFDQGTASYMAYSWNGATYIRASVCVPCQGRSFTLKGNTLVCNTCGTVFSAKTGAGISGVSACQNYPKAAVPFTTGADGNITMTKADLLTAFTNTLSPGQP